MRTWIVGALMIGLAAAAVRAQDTVATVGSKTITRAELEQHVKAKLVQVENQRFQVLSEGLDELVANELYEQEAKARGITVEQLAKSEVEAKAKPPTDDEVKKVYEDNKDDLEGQTLEQVKPQIVEYIKQQQLADLNQKFLDEMRKKHKTTIALKPPTVNVSDGGRAARGNAGAPVTIIEFSDYECPFCKRAFGTVEQVLKTYGDKVRFVHRDYPLPFHQSARPAAEAALCANDQGKFWDYQDKLFKSEDLSEPKLKSFAKEVGIDQAKFDDCLAKKPHGATIDKDVADGTEAGVNGTPAFFINGRMISGAQPFEKFKEIIDDELARAKKS